MAAHLFTTQPSSVHSLAPVQEVVERESEHWVSHIVTPAEFFLQLKKDEKNCTEFHVVISVTSWLLPHPLFLELTL